MLALFGPFIFLGVPLVLYLCQGFFVYASARRYGMTLAMTGYALANIGLIMDAHGL